MKTKENKELLKADLRKAKKTYKNTLRELECLTDQIHEEVAVDRMKILQARLSNELNEIYRIKRKLF